jgi:CRP-like cAMP-binding protein
VSAGSTLPRVGGAPDREAEGSPRPISLLVALPEIVSTIPAEDRELAERFGHMTAEGAVTDIDLTHEIIGRLVASRRPTVSLALQALAADGRLIRREDGRWELDPGAMSP